MLWFAAFLVIALAEEPFLGDLPMQNPDLFEGDIIGIEDPDDRNAIPVDELRWTNGVVPYTIDNALIWQVAFIKRAMTQYHQSTCIRFKERTNEQNYIRIFWGEGCYSNVGMVGGAQPLSLGRGCHYIGTIVHELGHAIGFYHEQNRSDRDDHLIIYWNNIKEGMADQFIKLLPHQNRLYNQFDYNSIMLYGERSFSKDGSAITMASKIGVKLLDAYEKPGLSESDIRRIAKLYQC